MHILANSGKCQPALAAGQAILTGPVRIRRLNT